MQAEEAARRAPLFEGVPQAPPPLKRSWYTVVTMGVVMGVMFGTGFVKSHGEHNDHGLFLFRVWVSGLVLFCQVTWW